MIPKVLTVGKFCVIFILQSNAEQLGTTFDIGGEILAINECILEYLASMLDVTYSILRPYGIITEETELLDLVQISAACVCFVVLVNRHFETEILLTCSQEISFHVSKIHEREM